MNNRVNVFPGGENKIEEYVPDIGTCDECDKPKTFYMIHLKRSVLYGSEIDGINKALDELGMLTTLYSQNTFAQNSNTGRAELAGHHLERMAITRIVDLP